MADLRVSQTVIESLDSGDPSLRVSQTVLEALEVITADMTVSQTVIEVLVRSPLTPGPGGGTGPTGVNPTPGIVPSSTPEVFAIITLDGVDYPFAVGQLNDDPSWYAGEKESRIKDITSIKYQLTKEGGPQAVSFTLTLLDGDRVFHGLAGAGGQMRGGFCSVYVIEHDDRIAELVPKRIGAGYITKYEGGDSFQFKLTVKDALSVRIAKIDKEPSLPRGRFTLTDFPLLDPSMDGKAIPLILGAVTDESASRIQGSAPPVYVATINLQAAFGGQDLTVDAYIWAQGAFVDNGITSVWYNDPTTPLVRYQVPLSAFGSIVWTPFWPGWTAATGLATNYVDYNGRRYTPFFILSSIPQAPLVKSGNILIAANIYGTEDVGDSTGNMIDDPANLTTFVLSQYVFDNYLTGTYGAIPTYEHAFTTPYSWIDTTTFDDVKTYFDGRLAGGYTCGTILGADGNAQTVFQFLQDMCAGVWMDIGINLDGQLIASVYDPLDTPVATVDATSDIEKATYTVVLDEQRLINRVEHEFAKYYVAPYAPAPTPAEGDPVPTTPIPSYPEYASGVQVVEDTASIAMVGDRLVLKLQNNVVRDSLVAGDVTTRILEESLGPTGAGPHVFSLRGGWHLLNNLRLGKNIYVIHPGKFGSGSRDLCRVTSIDIYPMQHRVVLGGDVIAHGV